MRSDQMPIPHDPPFNGPSVDKVKRYFAGTLNGHTLGNFVHYTDYAALAAERDGLRALLVECADLEYNWPQVAYSHDLSKRLKAVLGAQYELNHDAAMKESK